LKKARTWGFAFVTFSTESIAFLWTEKITKCSNKSDYVVLVRIGGIVSGMFSVRG